MVKKSGMLLTRLDFSRDHDLLFIYQLDDLLIIFLYLTKDLCVIKF